MSGSLSMSYSAVDKWETVVNRLQSDNSALGAEQIIKENPSLHRTKVAHRREFSPSLKLITSPRSVIGDRGRPFADTISLSPFSVACLDSAALLHQPSASHVVGVSRSIHPKV